MVRLKVNFPSVKHHKSEEPVVTHSNSTQLKSRNLMRLIIDIEAIRKGFFTQVNKDVDETIFNGLYKDTKPRQCLYGRRQFYY